MHLSDIQSSAVQQLLATRIVGHVQAGTLTRAQYARYLGDVLCYARHSSQVIGMAAVRLVASHPALADYLFEHAREELGHDRWVESDLRELGLSEAQIGAIQPSSPCLRMLGLEYLHAGHGNAIALFGWMFVLESLGGRVGGQIARGIDQALGLQGKALYFLTGHAEADADHARDLYDVISAHVTDEADRSAIVAMARESIDLYCGILDHAVGDDGSVG